MNTQLLHSLIDEAVDKYRIAAKLFPGYFNNLTGVCPIVWFGALNTDGPKVITFGCNPSDKEFLDKNHRLLVNPRFPKYFANTPLNIIKNIEEDDNEYFENNPYLSWFNSIRNFAAMYYNIAESSCIHIDALPFATSVKFTNLRNNTMPQVSNSVFSNFGDVLDWGGDFTRRLLEQIVIHDNVKGISIVGGVSIRRFEKIFADYITCKKEVTYPVGKRKFTIVKYTLCINSTSIEAVGTTIYLPNSYLGNKLNLSNLTAAIKAL